MRVFAVDIETTGLDCESHSLIEIAILSWDLHDKNAPVYKFHRYIIPENMRWTIFCLKLHRHMIDALITHAIPIDPIPEICDNFNVPIQIGKAKLIREIKAWLCSIAWTEKMTVVGKNFGSFDLRFIERLPGYTPMFHHRSLDPTSAFILPTDTVLPDLKACKTRAIELGCDFPSDVVTHNAMDDCEDVAKLMQFVIDRRMWNDQPKG